MPALSVTPAASKEEKDGAEVTVRSAVKTNPERTDAIRGEFDARLRLAHSGPRTLSVRYELAGEEGAPLLLVAGGISAGRHVIAGAGDPSEGWWQCQSDALGACRLLSIEWLGADGELDAPIDAADQADAILATLDHLGISRAAGFVGASYGAMVGMHCASIAPDRIGALLAISGADCAHPFSSALRALQRQAIELGEELGSPRKGVALARKLAILSYRTPQEFEGRFEGPVTIHDRRALTGAEPYLDHMGEKHSGRMSPVAYRRLSESIDLHRIEPGDIRVPSTFVGIHSDQLVPAATIEALARAVPDGRFVGLDSLYGHDAFLKEDRAIAEIIRNFVNSLEQLN